MRDIMDRRTFIRVSVAAGAAALLPAAARSLATRSDDDLKKGLIEAMKAKGAYDVRIADPHGFKQALPVPNPFKVGPPLTIWPECRSVVVVIVPYPPVLDNHLPVEQREAQLKNGSAGLAADGASAVFNVYHPLSVRVMSQALPAGARFLGLHGFKAMTSAGGLQVQGKLAAYESGLGVYGRSGLILHRELGNRMVILTLMTNAELEPDSPDVFETGCDGCGRCVSTCRGNAYGAKAKYPPSYTVTACGQSRNEVLMNEGGLCQNCFVNCPAARMTDKALTAWLEARV